MCKCYIPEKRCNSSVLALELHIDELVQERRNSIANVLELRLSCTNPWIDIFCTKLFKLSLQLEPWSWHWPQGISSLRFQGICSHWLPRHICCLWVQGISSFGAHLSLLTITNWHSWKLHRLNVAVQSTLCWNLIVFSLGSNFWNLCNVIQ